MNPGAGKGRRYHVYPCDMYCGLLERSWCQNGLKSDAGELLEVVFVPASTFEAPPRTQFAANQAETPRVYAVCLPPQSYTFNLAQQGREGAWLKLSRISCPPSGRLLQRFALPCTAHPKARTERIG